MQRHTILVGIAVLTIGLATAGCTGITGSATDQPDNQNAVQDNTSNTAGTGEQPVDEWDNDSNSDTTGNTTSTDTTGNTTTDTTTETENNETAGNETTGNETGTNSTAE